MYTEWGGIVLGCFLSSLSPYSIPNPPGIPFLHAKRMLIVIKHQRDRGLTAIKMGLEVLYPQRVAVFRRRLCSNRYYWTTRSECASPGADSTQNKRKGSLHRETYCFKVAMDV